MTIRVSVFRWVPPFAQGFVRDLRVRWALEELGLPYNVALVDTEVQKSADYRQWQPFGQVPAYEDEQVKLFESGAIVLHIAERSESLAPSDAQGRARVTAWVIAALNSIEPFAQNLIAIDVFHADEAWTKERRPQVQALLDQRLASLGEWLGDKPWLDGRFSAGDLVMATVLRELDDAGALAGFPVLEAYCRRCLARPAFDRALQAQLATFAQHVPGRSASGGEDLAR